MEKIKCSPIACMAVYVAVTSLMLQLALSPLKDNMKEIKADVSKIQDLLTIKPQQILKTGTEISVSSSVRRNS